MTAPVIPSYMTGTDCSVLSAGLMTGILSGSIGTQKRGSPDDGEHTGDPQIK